MKRMLLLLVCFALLGMLAVGCAKKVSGEKVVDPICGMEIEKSKALTYTHAGRTDYFCSQECLDKFKEQHKDHH